MKKDKMTNNDLQNTKDRETRNPKIGDELRCSRRVTLVTNHELGKNRGLITTSEEYTVLVIIKL